LLTDYCYYHYIMGSIYLIRHGESKANTDNFWLDDTFGLTTKGKRQSRKVAKLCKQLDINMIISSTLKRSQETAEIIGEILNKPIEYSDLFIERKWPSEQQSLPKDDPLAIKIKEKIWKNFSKPNFRYSDEENFQDLKKRVSKIFSFFERHKDKNILVITHGFTLRMILAYAVMGKQLTPIDADQFVDKFHTKNTGITVINRSKKQKRTNWYVSSWNSYSHLFE